jgi:hypothetical protein
VPLGGPEVTITYDRFYEELEEGSQRLPTPSDVKEMRMLVILI